MEKLCFGTGTTPVTKIIFKSMFGPCVMLFLLLTCGIQASMSKYIFSHSSFWKSFKVCLVRAFLLSVLFSYQQLLIAEFTLIQCVEINDKMVLILQADVECFTVWQQFIKVFLYVNKLPTFLVLSHASFYVAENNMSDNTFILTCLFPIPTIIVYHLGRYFKKNKVWKTYRYWNGISTFYHIIQWKQHNIWHWCNHRVAFSRYTKQAISQCRLWWTM